MTESATNRLSRLLTMVPWLLNRQGVEIEEAAREFGCHRRRRSRPIWRCCSCAALPAATTVT